jgi:antitoxin (DNA-binding transcriptional repressor) of toxin-antitoxin stability system
MTPISIEQAQARLPELLQALQEGNEFTILDENHVVARLVSAAPLFPKSSRNRSVKETYLLARERARALVEILNA